MNERRFELLEALATAVAETLLERFPVARVKVRVRKRPRACPSSTRPLRPSALTRSLRHSETSQRCVRDSDKTVTRAFVGLGANLGDREAAIRRGCSASGPHRLSSIRETEPWGSRTSRAS